MSARFFHVDSQFEFELQRTMGQVAYGAAEIGECLATARRIKEGDYDSWHDEWHDTANWLYALAEEAEQAGHLVTARESFLRCANYFRTAEFFLHGNPSDDRIRATSTRSVEAFRRAAVLLDPPIEQVEIPYEGTTLPGYFYRAEGDDGTPRPTVIMHNGFDGTGEEIYAFGGRAGQERGFHVLAFEGPGQGQVLRQQGLPFRPDWENVVTPVVDYAAGRAEVDADRIALVGVSLGGLLAPRAAAFEKRLAAVVAWDGVYDVGRVPLDVIFADAADDDETLLRRFAAESDPELDEQIAELVATNGNTRWVVDHGTWAMGAPHARALFHRLSDFHVKDGIAEQIGCPTLILEAADDFAFIGQPALLAQHLTASHDVMTFTQERGGELHNQVDVMRRTAGMIFDWLTEAIR